MAIDNRDKPIWQILDPNLTYKPEDFSPGLLAPGELEAWQKKMRPVAKALQKERAEKKARIKAEQYVNREAFWKKYPDMEYRHKNRYICPFTDRDTIYRCSYGDCRCESEGKLPQRPVKREFPV